MGSIRLQSQPRRLSDVKLSENAETKAYIPDLSLGQQYIVESRGLCFRGFDTNGGKHSFDSEGWFIRLLVQVFIVNEQYHLKASLSYPHSLKILE